MATKEEVAAFIAVEFPQTKCVVRAVGNSRSTVAHEVGPSELRPGGTVAGPVLMAVADVALYVAILGEIGIVPLTVTTSFSINFLRKPPGRQKHSRCLQTPEAGEKACGGRGIVVLRGR